MTFEICDLEDFVSDVTAQVQSLEHAASTMELFMQQVEGYLQRMRQAMCNDVLNLEIQIAAGGGGGGGGLPDLVDDTEVASGRTVNGNPSYFKLVDCGTLPGAGSNTATAHNIANPFTCISMFGSAVRPSPLDNRPLPFVAHSFATSQILIAADPTDVVIFVTNNFSAWTGKVLLEYIKV